MGIIVLLFLVVVVGGGGVKPTLIVLLPAAGLCEATISTNCCFFCFLFLSVLWMRAGYETNDEEKRKKKFKPASVKESPSHLRLLHFGSSGPLDNHLS